jgi:RHS repeat-associated protein
MTDNTGAQVGDTVKYLPFGVCRNSPDLPTDKLFTGQRLDATGLYYYNARYYDSTIGRFISPDTEGVDYNDPQSLNRYTYCSNNPLKYTDPSGHSEQDYWNILAIAAVCAAGYDVSQLATDILGNMNMRVNVSAYTVEAHLGAAALVLLTGISLNPEAIIPIIIIGGVVLLASAFSDALFGDPNNSGEPGDPGYGPNKGNLKPVDQRYLERQGMDIHDIKYKTFGEKAKIADWDLKIDTSDGSFWLLNKFTNATVYVARDYFELSILFMP